MSEKHPVNAAQPGQLTTLVGILAEFDLFKENYASDSLVQAMAAQLELLQSQAGQSAAPVASQPPQAQQPSPDVVSAISGYLRVCRSGGMPSKQADLVEKAVAEAQHLGYFVNLAEQPGIDSSDRERLLYVARVLRAIADLDRDAKLGNLWSESVTSVGTIKRVLNIKDEDCAALGLTAASMSAPSSDGTPLVSKLLDGWKEAAIAWEVCGSIHSKWAKGKDALFTTRQEDMVRHAEDARTMYRTLLGPGQDTVTG